LSHARGREVTVAALRTLLDEEACTS
jgi:hypothetical protein